MTTRVRCVVLILCILVLNELYWISESARTNEMRIRGAENSELT
jgi:hypothetical protein